MLSAHPTEAEAVEFFLANSVEFKKMREIAKNEKPTIDSVQINNEPPSELRSYPQKKLVGLLEKTQKFSTIIEGTELKLGDYTSAFSKIIYVGSFFNQKANFMYHVSQMREKAKNFASQYVFASPAPTDTVDIKPIQLKT